MDKENIDIDSSTPSANGSPKKEGSNANSNTSAWPLKPVSPNKAGTSYVGKLSFLQNDNIDSHFGHIHAAHEEMQQQLQRVEIQTAQTGVDLEQLCDRLKNNNVHLNKLLLGLSEGGFSTREDIEEVLATLQEMSVNVKDKTSGAEEGGKVEELVRSLSEEMREKNSKFFDELKENKSVVLGEIGVNNGILLEGMKEGRESSCKEIINVISEKIEGGRTSLSKEIEGGSSTISEKIEGGVSTLSNEIKESNSTLSNEIKESNSTLSNEIKENNSTLSKEILESNATLSKELLESNTTLSKELLNSNATLFSELTSIKESSTNKELTELVSQQSIEIQRLTSALSELSSYTKLAQATTSLEQKYSSLQSKYDALCHSYTAKYTSLQGLEEQYSRLVELVRELQTTPDEYTVPRASARVNKFHKLHQLHSSKMGEILESIPQKKFLAKRIASTPNKTYIGEDDNNSDEF